ncbi:integrase, catalytic region, zinc finger, CCHC-type containing protein [Tanacetum coccineum]
MSTLVNTSSTEISVVKQKYDELLTKSLLTRSQFEGQLKEKTKVISDLKVKEGKDIDTMIEMDKQIKFLNEILYKRNQSIQTIHMLAPKCATYHGRSTFANPKYLKKAQSDKPRLYEIPYDTSDPANRFCPDGEDTVTLEKESRSKLDKDKVKPYNYTYQNSLYETFKPPSKAYLDQLERAKEVRKTMWRKTGCGKQSLGTWYDSCEKLAVAEHRYFLRGPGDAAWKTCGWHNCVGWMENAELILNIYGEAACDGSYIEMKESVMVWHYKNAGEFGQEQAKDILEHLEKCLCLSLGNAVDENKELNFDRITTYNTKDCNCWDVGSKKSMVTSVEMSKKSLDHGEVSGDNVGLPLHGISRTGIQIGQTRALLKGRFLSMRGHAKDLGCHLLQKDNGNRMGVCQPCLLSSIASIFGCNVYTVQRLGNLTCFAEDLQRKDLLTAKRSSFKTKAVLVPMKAKFVPHGLCGHACCKPKWEKSICNLYVHVFVRTDRGTEFLNKNYAYYKEEGIEHQTSLLETLNRTALSTTKPYLWLRLGPQDNRRQFMTTMTVPPRQEKVVPTGQKRIDSSNKGYITHGTWYPKILALKTTSIFRLCRWIRVPDALITGKALSDGIQLPGCSIVSWMSKKQNCTCNVLQQRRDRFKFLAEGLKLVSIVRRYTLSIDISTQRMLILNSGTTAPGLRHNKSGVATFRLENGYAGLRDALSFESVRFWSIMSAEDLAAVRDERQLVDSLWTTHYNEPSSLRVKVSWFFLVLTLNLLIILFLKQIWFSSASLQQLKLSPHCLALPYSPRSVTPVTCTITVPKLRRCRDLIRALSNACSLKQNEQILLAEVQLRYGIDLMKADSTVTLRTMPTSTIQGINEACSGQVGPC